MTKPQTPTRDQNKFIIRMPDGLRERISYAARDNGRSMNAEITRLLEINYPEMPSPGETLELLEIFLKKAIANDTPKDRSFIYNLINSYMNSLEYYKETGKTPADIGRVIEVRFSNEELDALYQACTDLPGEPSQEATIRGLVVEWLIGKGYLKNTKDAQLQNRRQIDLDGK